MRRDDSRSEMANLNGSNIKELHISEVQDTKDQSFMRHEARGKHWLASSREDIWKTLTVTKHFPFFLHSCVHTGWSITPNTWLKEHFTSFTHRGTDLCHQGYQPFFRIVFTESVCYNLGMELEPWRCIMGHGGNSFFQGLKITTVSFESPTSAHNINNQFLARISFISPLDISDCNIEYQCSLVSKLSNEGTVSKKPRTFLCRLCANISC